VGVRVKKWFSGFDFTSRAYVSGFDFTSRAYVSRISLKIEPVLTSKVITLSNEILLNKETTIVFSQVKAAESEPRLLVLNVWIVIPVFIFFKVNDV